MYDLHIHSLLSDGALLPSEIVRRYEAKGYRAIAITDHVDSSNIENVINKLSKFMESLSAKKTKLKVLSGVEITHVALEEFKPLAKYARERGVRIIVGHGETLVEPVIKGTNRAALEAGIDILAHPGLITEADVKLAVKHKVYLEVSARRGHCLTNGHLVKMAQRLNAEVVINSDSHIPQDILGADELRLVGLGAGIPAKGVEKILKSAQQLINSKL